MSQTFNEIGAAINLWNNNHKVDNATWKQMIDYLRETYPHPPETFNTAIRWFDEAYNKISG